MRRLRRGLKRLWRMSDPYYRVKDDGLVAWLPNQRISPEQAHLWAQSTVQRDGPNKPYYRNDPSYDWAAQTRRAKELRKAGSHG